MKKFKNYCIIKKKQDTALIGIIENGKIATTQEVSIGGGAFILNNKLFYINDFM